jgi:glycosyltransferase involved in cell wall biosynthesis
MARFHDVTVLTQGKNRTAIERGLAAIGNRQPVPQFEYFDRAKYLQPLRRREAGLRLYYWLWQKAAWERIQALHRARSFELIHHATFAAFRYPTAIWGHGVPTIWGPIGGIEDSPLRLLPWSHFLALVPELIRNVHNATQRLPFNPLPRRLRATTVTLASTLDMRDMFARLGYAARAMPTIGLCTADIPYRERSLRQGPLRLLYVGNLIALKGLHLAIEALAQSGTSATLAIIGSGGLQAALERQARRLGLGQRVTFLNRLPREEVMNRYPEFDVMLFPSFHDTGGYAVIEAMCQALPVVCLDCGGPGLAVREGSGIRVPLGSRREVVTGFATAIRAYDQDRPLLLEHGLGARQTILQNYDWDKKGEQLAAVYGETVASWKAERLG